MQPVSGDDSYRVYSPTAPYASLDTPPGALLDGSAQVDTRVSLRQQQAETTAAAAAALAAQQRLRAQPAWRAAGSTPPGKLLHGPTSSYTVPTEAMAQLLHMGQTDSAKAAAAVQRAGVGAASCLRML